MNHRSTHRCFSIGLCMLVGVLATGCSTFRAGPERAQKSFAYQGPIGAYASASDLRAYDGDLLQADLWSNSQQPGELLNLDLWPIGGIGIGAFGVRAHIASLGAGIGFIFYHPKSARSAGRIEEISL